MNSRSFSIQQAKALLDEKSSQYCENPASAKTTSSTSWPEAADRSWWFKKNNIIDVNSPRSRALLHAYITIGGDVFPMIGIPLSDGYLRPDRTLMRSLDRAGWMIMQDGAFKITPEGRAALEEGEREKKPAYEIAKKNPSEEDGLSYSRSGEGDNHRALRLWVRDNPSELFPYLTNVTAETEVVLPSADRMDVQYSTVNKRIALEVKSRDSNEADLARGIYQCVKYRAVLSAMIEDPSIEVKAYLVTEHALPNTLLTEAKRLHVLNIIVPPNRKM